MTIVSPKARRVWFTPIGQAVGRCGRRRDRTLEGLPRHLPRPRHPRVASFSRSRRLCCGAPATKVHFRFCSRCQEKTFFLCISMCCTINARNKRARAIRVCSPAALQLAAAPSARSRREPCPPSPAAPHVHTHTHAHTLRPITPPSPTSHDDVSSAESVLFCTVLYLY